MHELRLVGNIQCDTVHFLIEENVNLSIRRCETMAMATRLPPSPPSASCDTFSHRDWATAKMSRLIVTQCIQYQLTLLRMHFFTGRLHLNLN